MIRVALFEPIPELGDIFAFILGFKGVCDVVLKSDNWQVVEGTLTRIDVLYTHIYPKSPDLDRIVKIREIYPNLGIVIYSDIHTREEIIEAGADIHLCTPINHMIITEVVQSAYAKRK
jgi:hypothetical protein